VRSILDATGHIDGFAYVKSGLGAKRLPPRSGSVFIDVTGCSTEPALTGIQRVSRTLAEAAGDSATLIFYDESRRVFYELSRLPRLISRAEKGLTQWFRQRVRIIFETARLKLESSGTGFLVPMGLKRWLWNFYVQHLLAQKLEPIRHCAVGAVEFPETATLVVSEIPRGRMHLRTLIDLASRVKDLRIYLHDLIPLLNPELINANSRESTRGHFLEYLELVRSAKRVMCNSETTRTHYEQFRGLFPPDNQKIEVLLPPSPSHLQSVDQRPPRDSFKDKLWPRPFNNVENQISVLLVGNLGVRKNFEPVVRAVFNGVSRGLSLRLLIVASPGRDVAPGLVEALTGASPLQRQSVTFFSQLRDTELETLFKFADIFCWPSLNEGFGLPVLEALSQGTPVAALDTPINRELAELCEFTVVESSDPLEWLSAIRTVSRKGDAARSRPIFKENVPSSRDFFTRLCIS